MMFKVIHFQPGVQSHHVLSITTFKVVFLSLTFIVIIGVHSRCFCLAFMAIIFSLAFKATIYSQFGIQSHVHSSAFRVIISFSVLAFRAIITASQFQRSEPSSSHFFFQRSEPSLSLLSFGVQSHHHHIFSLTFRVAFSVSAFRAIIIAFLVSAFRSIIIAS